MFDRIPPLFAEVLIYGLTAEDFVAASTAICTAAIAGVGVMEAAVRRIGGALADAFNALDESVDARLEEAARRLSALSVEVEALRSRVAAIEPEPAPPDAPEPAPPDAPGPVAAAAPTPLAAGEAA